MLPVAFCGEMQESGTVAEKWGDVRRKLTLRKSLSREATSAFIMEVISRCQSRRVVITNGPTFSMVLWSGSMWYCGGYVHTSAGYGLPG